jgi:hypothetical protein
MTDRDLKILNNKNLMIYNMIIYNCKVIIGLNINHSKWNMKKINNNNYMHNHYIIKNKKLKIKQK